MFENAFVFLKKQTANIVITLLGAIIPFFLEIFINTEQNNVFSWKIEGNKNFLFQSILVLMTLWALIRVRKYVVHDVEDSKEQIKQYILKNCGLKIFNRDRTAELSFRTVQETVSQFFNAWLVVWLMWLIYYGGGLLISYSVKTCYCNMMVLTTYQQIFDFLNSTAMFAIYIILSRVTVNSKERNHQDTSFLDDILVWAILLIIFVSGVIVENCIFCSNIEEILSFYVSAISTITFVLILGKMNSSYLKIPPFLMLVLYVYAVTQLYVPFKDFGVVKSCWFKTFLDYALPYITLIGKIFLMLTICWIAVQRRFIFFVIHRSTTIDKIDDLMSELNKENVSF